MTKRMEIDATRHPPNTNHSTRVDGRPFCDDPRRVPQEPSGIRRRRMNLLAKLWHLLRWWKTPPGFPFNTEWYHRDQLNHFVALERELCAQTAQYSKEDGRCIAYAIRHRGDPVD